MQASTLKGNITLLLDDLIVLQNGVIKKYSESIKVPSDEISRQFNSNFKSDFYQKFISYLAKRGINLGISTKNPKPLSEIFYFTKDIRNKGLGSFRRQLVNALSEFAFSKGIDEVFLTQEVSLINKLSGYWECYYDKEGTFKNSMMGASKTGKLGIIAITISGDNINDATVRYFQNKSWGFGTLNIFGANFVLHLMSEKNHEPTMQIMNCGRVIEGFANHVREAAGMFIHINDKSNPKYGKCLMLYFNDDEVHRKYPAIFKSKDVDLNHGDFFGIFTLEKNNVLVIDDNDLNKVDGNAKHKKIRDFFMKGINTSDVHINDYDAID